MNAIVLLATLSVQASTSIVSPFTVTKDHLWMAIAKLGVLEYAVFVELRHHSWMLGIHLVLDVFEKWRGLTTIPGVRRGWLIVVSYHLLFVVLLGTDRPDVILEREHGVVDDHYGAEKAEEGLVAQGYLSLWGHLELLQPMIEGAEGDKSQEDAEYHMCPCDCCWVKIASRQIWSSCKGLLPIYRVFIPLLGLRLFGILSNLACASFLWSCRIWRSGRTTISHD